MLSKRGSQARKSQSMTFLHPPRVVFFLTAGFGLPTLLPSGALENLHVASVSLRCASSKRTPPPPPLGRSALSPTRLVSVVLNLFREIGGRPSPEYDFHTRSPLYDIQDHVCSTCPLFVFYFLRYKIIFLTLFIRRSFSPVLCYFYFFIRFPDSL